MGMNIIKMASLFTEYFLTFFFLLVINLRVDRDCYLLGKKLWFLVTHMKNNDSFKAFVRFD
jgi:hypothetical protein